MGQIQCPDAKGPIHCRYGGQSYAFFHNPLCIKRFLIFQNLIGKQSSENQMQENIFYEFAAEMESSILFVRNVVATVFCEGQT